MRKVDVVRPPINYVVGTKVCGQIAWFLTYEDAKDFLDLMQDSENVYWIAEVRR